MFRFKKAAQLFTLSPRNPERKNKKRFSLQRAAYMLHSFFGLKLTLILTLVLASGTLAVISHEIDWVLTPEMRVSPAPTRINDGELFDQLQAAYPDNGLSFFQPNHAFPHTAATAIVKDDQGGFRNAWIDPYTGDIHDSTALLTVGAFLRFLHTTLFLPVVGRSVVNAFGVFTLISLVTGLIAVPKFWRYFFRLPRTNNLRAFLIDAHKFVGVWSLWFLLIMAVSGTWWFYQKPLVLYAGAPRLHEAAKPKPMIDEAVLNNAFDNANTPLNTSSGDVSNTQPPTLLSTSDIIQSVKQRYPDMIVTGLFPPEHSADPFQVTGQREEWLVLPNSSNRVWVNPYDGSIIGEDLIQNNSLMQRFDKSMAPLHYGSWAGSGYSDLLVKGVWFIFGALMTGLAVSGLILNYKRTKRSANILAKRSQSLKMIRRYWRSLWPIIKPWGGPMGGFKYINVLIIVGVLIGTRVVFILASQGVSNAGFEYSEKAIGPWHIKVNAFAGLLEKDLAPIRAGKKTNLSVQISSTSVADIKFMYARIGKPDTTSQLGHLIRGPKGNKQVKFKLPKELNDNAQLWITAQTWSGQVYQAHWPLWPDGQQTLDIR